MQNYNSKLIINQNINKISYVAILVILGILFRTAWHLAPNVEYVTAATLLAASYLGKKWAILVPLAIMAITDLIIGNTNIFLFTWSAYILIGIVGYWGLKTPSQRLVRLGRKNDKVKFKMIKIIKATGFGIAAGFWFYLWTNFGVWLLDSFGMYPKTLNGLIDAYILAIPFLKYNLIGNLFFIPVSFTIVEVSRNYSFGQIVKRILNAAHL